MKPVVVLGVFFSVVAASAFEVDIECPDRKGWTIEKSSEAVSDGIDEVTIRMTAGEMSSPPMFTVRYDYSGVGVQHIWTCDWHFDTYRLWPEAWVGRAKNTSQLAYGTPIAVAFGPDEKSRLAVACSETFEKVDFAIQIKESTCVLKGFFTFFTEPVAPCREYSVKLRFDRRVSFWADAVADQSRWIVNEAGFKPAYTPESAFDPLYSTWYAFWQDVSAAPLEREAALAAELGMKTMILDDGWQKLKSASFYSATGDWMPVPDRFPDMKKHVDTVHRAGLKYMLWMSVPYVGDESKAWAKFKDKMLYVDGRKSPGRVGVLDPRFPEVRKYLISTYERAVGEWGFDGLKLDFIDSFKIRGVDPAVKEGYAGRDFKSVPEAVDRLMKDVLSTLRKINPDVLIEFRQNYMGPAILQYGNMIRACDCPADPWANRKRICDLRLTSGSTSVHSDMIVWNGDESPAGAALPILNALFGTIQYSMVLDRASADHRRVIRHWLDFSQRHRKTLLKGALRPRHPQNAYTMVEAESPGERITAVYNPDSVAGADPSGKTEYVINATLADSLVVECAARARAEIFNTFGEKTSSAAVGAGISRIAVPAGGYAKLAAE